MCNVPNGRKCTLFRKKFSPKILSSNYFHGFSDRRKQAGITPITFDASSPPKKPATDKKTQMEYYLPPGKRGDASNGSVEGKSMLYRYNRGGNNRGFRGRRGRGRSRGNNRGWRW